MSERAQETDPREDAPASLAESTDDARPPFEVRVEPETKTPQQRVKIAALLCAAAALAIYQPWSFGVALALPCFFAWLGYRVTVQAQRPYTLRVTDAGLEILTAGCADVVDWSHVESVMSGPGDFTTLHFAGGGVVQLPARAVSDRTALLRALPDSVRRDLPPPEPTSAEQKKQSTKTVLLWVVLVVMLYAVYQVMRSAP
ncbi:MAG: hypothetical protein M3Y87_05675 [Myxococcota bacterium]|nr:hypothetical protein [Myxococcota bacterium]